MVSDFLNMEYIVVKKLIFTLVLLYKPWVS